ncbi:MAG: nuclear transport factor 2 family protein [Reichenbachiella sp.]
MERRDFIQKTMMATGAIAISSSNAFTNIIKKQNFDFMTQDHPNLSLIHDFFKAYGNNDLSGIKKVLSEEIEWHIPGEHPLSGTKTGVDEVLGFFKKLNLGAFKAEPIIMGVNDNYVIDCHRNWSNIEGSENLNAMSCLLWRIEDNKIKEVHNFPENQKDVDTFFKKLYG